MIKILFTIQPRGLLTQVCDELMRNSFTFLSLQVSLNYIHILHTDFLLASFKSRKISFDWPNKNLKTDFPRLGMGMLVIGHSGIRSTFVLQVNNLEKVPIAQYFIKTFHSLFYTAVLWCKIFVQILWQNGKQKRHSEKYRPVCYQNEKRRPHTTHHNLCSFSVLVAE